MTAATPLRSLAPRAPLTRAPSQADWDALSPAERAALVDALPISNAREEETLLREDAERRVEEAERARAEEARLRAEEARLRAEEARLRAEAERRVAEFLAELEALRRR